MPKDIGLLFCPQMIAALLRPGGKSMTRRAGKELKEINKNPDDWELLNSGPEAVAANIWVFQRRDTHTRVYIECPYEVGDTVYCKEPHAFEKQYDKLPSSELEGEALWWKSPLATNYGRELERGRWRSAMFMPKFAARIWRTITAIGCERVQDITWKDAIYEGIYGLDIGRGGVEILNDFKALWFKLNGKKHPWEKNPYVWKLTIPEEKTP